MSFFKNGIEYYTGTFKTVPQLETGTVPSGSVYNQGSYPTDSYNSICYTTQDPSLVYKCDGRPGEVPYTIQRKGCALVSGTIILGYNGITVNAVDLDAWLVANGGYNLVGGLYFEKVAEYARKVHNINVQYNRKLTNCTWEELENLICNYGPQVLKVFPHHYVVTGGMDENKTTFLLSDPDGGVETTLAADYGNYYTAVRSFRGPDYYLYPSMFVVLLHSPGELLITDANGNMTGLDPITGESYDDIPNSSYGVEALYDSETGLVGPEWNELEIVQPEEGEYTLRITGTDEGTYRLEMLGYDESDESFSFLTDDIPIYDGAIHEYSIQYGTDPESVMKIEGGYDGDSQRKWDVNQLLSYFTIAAKTVQLPSGIMQYALGITYHEDIDPVSFTAVLNDTDISDLFNPVPDSSEIVTIDLAQGSNSLVLTINGDVPAKMNIDTDKFEIIATP